MMIRLLSLLTLALTAVLAHAGGSTINTAIPAVNSALQSGPLRANFAAAAADINGLIGLNSGAVAPVSPILGQMWLNTTTTPYVLSVWDGAAWDAMGTLSSSASRWLVPIAQGGTNSTTASAALSNLGGAPLTGTGTSGTWPISISGQAASVPATTVTPGTYTNSNITVGADGRVTAAANGGGGMVYPGAGIPNSTGAAWSTSYSVRGNGSMVQLSTGTTTTNDCVKFDANGNTVDAGAACGSGSGSVTWPTTNNVVISNGTNTPASVAPGTSGNNLTSNGTTWVSSAPTAPSLGTPTITGGTMTMGGNATYGNTHQNFVWAPIAPSGTPDTWLEATGPATPNYGPEYNQVHGFGWNITDSWGLSNPAHSGFTMRFENYYEPLVAGTGQHEFHTDIIPTDTATAGEIRPIAFDATANQTRANTNVHIAFEARTVNFNHPDLAGQSVNSAELIIGPGPAYLGSFMVNNLISANSLNLNTTVPQSPSYLTSSAPNSTNSSGAALYDESGSNPFYIGHAGSAQYPGVTNPTTVGDAWVSNHGTGSMDIYNYHANPIWFGINNTLIGGWSAGGRLLIGNFTDDGVNLLQVAGSAIVSTSQSAAKYLTNTKCASSASPAVCSAAPAGAVVVAAAATSVVVNTTAVTASSQIIVTNDSSRGTLLSVTCNTAFLAAPPQITTRTAGTSFTLTLSAAPSTNPQCFSYSIIN